MQNGENLGVAFENVDISATWCPAVSLTSQEWGRFLFGSQLDPLIYCPEGFMPIGATVEKVNSQIHVTNNLRDSSPSEKPIPSPKPTREHLKTRSKSSRSSEKSFFSKSPTTPLRIEVFESRIIEKLSPTKSVISSDTDMSEGTVILDRNQSLMFYYEIQLGFVTEAGIDP